MRSAEDFVELCQAIHHSPEEEKKKKKKKDKNHLNSGENAVSILLALAKKKNSESFLMLRCEHVPFLGRMI